MIDRPTIDRIIETADIVEVVSEFVSLRKSGANYKGLCPFHNERTPSFYVSPARGICKCFSCGKGGNPVGFVMEHEQMTYPEALRWLAKKYGIEIKERELSDEEKKQESDRESMFIVNEWAAGYFEDLLHNSEDGMAIGMQYFRSRGFRDDTISRFRLGYSAADREALPQTAIQKGYKEEFLLKTGVCYKRENDGGLTDRFAGRVIFPWIGISGKVVAFGGRKLDQATKGIQQKYVNSPDSEIYHKEQQLYGIFQAKKAIAKENCVYMVEGYTDVISMHQSGIENVVANSGTALSVHQIRILRRFTPNVVLLYDGDEAGIHAAIRGTDMMLAEGMNIKVLLLPDGDDPDSFARKHTAKDFREYVVQNQKDFIEFKTDLLIRGVSDPIKRAEAVNSIIQSISMIKDQIVRATYINLCVHRLGINEPTIISTLNKFIRSNMEGERKRTQTVNADNAALSMTQSLVPASPQAQSDIVEKMIAQLIVNHGGDILYRNVQTEDGETIDMRVAQYIGYDLGQDDIRLKNPVYARILDEAAEHCNEPDFNSEQYFTQHTDVELSNAATQMLMDVPLAKSLQITKDEETLINDTNHLLLDLRKVYIEERLGQLKAEISKAAGDNDTLRTLMAEYAEAQIIRNKIAKELGNEIVT
ncbi:DNA primase [Prevotella sp. OH937_COT-195]|uniref:DNA primase n=1 Tax=Prevotella sp. OH937_COT-195 TaxID=2491051 RepID=UPI000F654CBA|nr:DNA primase [Prevotella sp. OH937_COT-195]RRD02639.1 DNA primase [Prevotella sp. OH937_COT-195]